MNNTLTDSDLELIEARAKYAAGVDSYVERWDLPSTGDDKIIIHRSDVLWLIEALREARAKVAQLMGIIEGLEDASAGRVKTFDTIDDMLAELAEPPSDEPPSQGGERAR
jgi:hypothetical protein